MSWQRCALLTAALVAGSANQTMAAEPFLEEGLRVALPVSGSTGLEALLVRPDQPGRYPLALITHGSPRSGAERPDMTPLAMLPQALELARRGWAAVVVMRRGYGDSAGSWAENYGGCANPDYVAAGNAGAADLKAAIGFLARQPDIDASRTISIGVSAGGFATVALAADPPPGLVAAISFAGGRGSLQDGQVCQSNRLIEAYRIFGERSRIPMLWVYAQNDHFFAPVLAQQFKTAFAGSGGNVDFITAPAFGDDGHGLFSPAGIPAWTGYVDAFLRQHNLVMRAAPLPLPRSALAVPGILGGNGRKAFAAYVFDAPHKAFAVSSDGYFGWRGGQRTTAAAMAGALKFCEQSGKHCDVIVVDDAAQPDHPSAR